METSTLNNSDGNSTVNPVVFQSSLSVELLLKVSRYLQVVQTYINNPLGIVGCVLILIIMHRSNLSSSGFSVYVSSLAVSDGFRLIAPIVYYFVKEFTTPPVWMCQVLNFVAYVAVFTSDLIVTTVAVDRTLAVVVPHKIKVLSTADILAKTIHRTFKNESVSSLFIESE